MQIKDNNFCFFIYIEFVLEEISLRKEHISIAIAACHPVLLSEVTRAGS